MNILISRSSEYPIYQQIYQQIKEMILTGSLLEDDALPSIRLLAKELRISVITTKRAYDELERDGFVVSVPGKGSFVAATNLDLVRETHLKQMQQHLKDAIQAAKLAGVERDELIQALQQLEEEL